MSNIFGTDHTATHDTFANGDQYKFTFANGYGASVIRHDFSYGHEAGKWELAVLKDDRCTYDTPITDDVIGWLSEADVAEKLHAIAALPQAGA